VQDPSRVQHYFSQIADRYDFANRLLSGGVDLLWRGATTRRVAAQKPGEILDVATGSGDLMLQLQRALPGARVIGTDFCRPMLERARAKGLQSLVVADGLALPFPRGRFDAVTIAFGLRNMADYRGAIAEFHRILRTGGWLYILDFSRPEGWFGAVYRFYLHRVLPRVAGWVTRHPEAYEYLGESIEAFPSGRAMCDLLEEAGFSTATAIPFTGGIVTLYSACKVAEQQ